MKTGCEHLPVLFLAPEKRVFLVICSIQFWFHYQQQVEVLGFCWSFSPRFLFLHCRLCIPKQWTNPIRILSFSCGSVAAKLSSTYLACIFALRYTIIAPAILVKYLWNVALHTRSQEIDNMLISSNWTTLSTNLWEDAAFFNAARFQLSCLDKDLCFDSEVGGAG